MNKSVSQPEKPRLAPDSEAPLATASFRRRAWLEFQRALDPLAVPKQLRPPQPPRV